jgi:hypothetical protein
VIGVKDESALLKAFNKTQQNGIRCTVFREADLDDQATALATEPVYGDTRRIFQNYQLLRPSAQLV